MAVTVTPPQQQSAPARPGNRLAAATALLGVGAATVSLLGPLGAGTIRYHASEGAVNQVRGGDVAGLVLVAPLCLLAAALVWRGHRAGPVLAQGPALYGLYLYSQLALGGDVARYPGNAELFFPLFVGLCVIAATTLVWALAATEWTTLRAPIRAVDRILGSFFLVVATFLLFGLHLPGLLDAWSGQPASAEYLADPNLFWLVKLMDLGIVVPGLLVVGIGLLRRRSWALRGRYGASGWAALLGTSVAGMAIVMQATDDPSASLANTIAFSAFAAIALVLAYLAHRPLFGDG